MTSHAEFNYLWPIGDTTVRNPHRMKDALAALYDSPLNGNISDSKGKRDLAILWKKSKVIDYKGVEEKKGTRNNIGKWCMTLSRFGFITPKLTHNLKSPIDPALALITKDIEDLTGRPYEVTHSGRRLIESDDIIEENECILRALICYRTLSPLNLNDANPIEEKFANSFSPLKFVLDIIHELERLGLKSSITSDEYALFIQTSLPSEGIDNVTSRIADYRKMRKKGNIKDLNRSIENSIARRAGKNWSATHKDLYDRTNCAFFHLKGSGLFYESSGRGIELFESQKTLADFIRNQYVEYSSFEDYLRTLMYGGTLPVDDKSTAISIIEDLRKKLNDKGIKISSPDLGKSTNIAVLHKTRHRLQKKLMEEEERIYASEQVDNVEEILGYFEIIPKNTDRGRSKKISNGKKLKVRGNERPAYLEWAVWRAFLAIGDICNAPWNARKFQVSREFMPLRHAPPRVPDMVFEFENAVVVVEVTLTSSSRQEAAEGEPVRRHVADYVKDSSKAVYGLFIAPEIDNNTAHTFIDGNWYFSDNDRRHLEIVPVTLSDFGLFLKAVVGKQGYASNELIQLILECRRMSNAERYAPVWKKSISSRFVRLHEAQSFGDGEAGSRDTCSCQVDLFDANEGSA